MTRRSIRGGGNLLSEGGRGGVQFTYPWRKAGQGVTRTALRRRTPSAALPDDLDFSVRHLCIPGEDGTSVAAADVSPQSAMAIRAKVGWHVRITRTAHSIVWNQLAARHGARALEDAIWLLARSEPQFSAYGIPGQVHRWMIAALAMTICAAFIFWPHLSLDVVAVATGLAFVANAAFRLVLVWIGGRENPWDASNAAHAEEDWPLYTVLVPLYREAHMVPQIMHAMDALDYPRDRLDIKIIVEADDMPTVAAADAFAGDPRVQVLKVPQAEPRTKPKATNVALPFARGEFTVIYDAEDRPEPDQLKKAVRTFRMLSPDVGCLQARLNFYNADRNILTQLFAADFALWFDYLLPGLDRVGIPMPLGGTSNHFRTEVLRALHGWDPFNVTEDADLGIRMARVGKRVRTFDSTTFEEATATLNAWLPQRARWLKGYMQTWLVNMRNPLRLWSDAGSRGFFGFQLFIGGTVAAALANPLLWLIYVVQAWGGGDVHPALIAILGGNLLFIFLSMIGLVRRGWYEFVPAMLFAPLYWLLMSVAGYLALYDLAVRPFHWRKTSHGAAVACAP